MSVDDWYEADLLMEIEMMKTSKHPNIVTYMDAYKDSSRHIWVTLTYHPSPLLPPSLFPRTHDDETHKKIAIFRHMSSLLTICVPLI